MNAEISVWRREVSVCSDSQLVERVSRMTGADRKLTARLIVYLGEVEERGLYREHAFSSMFNYLVEGLHMSEGEAGLQLTAARLARKFPVVIEMLAAGEVHLSGLAVIARFFTEENHAQLLGRLRGKTMREALLLAAELEPKPDVPARIRKLPQAALPLPVVEAPQAPSASSAVATASTFTFPAPREKPAVCLPLGGDRYKLQLTATQEMNDKIEQLRHLLRHQVPDGDLATIVEKALDVLLAQTLKQRFAQTRKPRSEKKPSAPQPTAAGPERRSRSIPHAVLRAVYKRDGGQCAFVSRDGRRCSERGRLEVHHVVAFAVGGASTVENLKLVCRSHNLWHAEQDFGRDFMRRKSSQMHLST